MLASLTSSSWLGDDSSAQIPSDFISQVLQTRATTAPQLLFWRVSEMVLKRALIQLDPNRSGMSVTIVECMPPSRGGKVRSLRERYGRGTSPWVSDLGQRSLFLGMESLAGHCVEVRHVINVSDLHNEKLIPAYADEFEVSSAAHPIWLGGHIAGCLRASSTQIAHFTPLRLSLLAKFSDLISLAFNEDEFYSPASVELKVLPSPEQQRPILATYQQRLQKALIAANQPRYAGAERIAWQEIEEILLDLPFDRH